MPAGFGAFGSAGSGYVGSGFTPRSIAGCVLWLRADLGVTIATGVNAWADQSGVGNNVTQGTGSKQPTVNTADAAYNGKDTFSFASASAQCLQGTFVSSITQPFTLFLVGQNGRSGSQSYFDGSTVGGRCECYNDATTDKVYAGSAFVSAADNSTSPRIMTYEMNGASSKIYISSNTAAVTGNPGTDGLAGATIGAAYDKANDVLNGKIAEVILYTGALSAANQDMVRAYLSARYGIALS